MFIKYCVYIILYLYIMNNHNIVTLAVGAIIVENIVLYMLYFNKKRGKTITQWYS